MFSTTTNSENSLEIYVYYYIQLGMESLVLEICAEDFNKDMAETQHFCTPTHVNSQTTILTQY